MKCGGTTSSVLVALVGSSVVKFGSQKLRDPLLPQAMSAFARMESTEVTFVYSRTFIDEAPASDVIGAQLRSASEPPAMTRLETASEAMSEEESLRGYVRFLGTSFTRGFPDSISPLGIIFVFVHITLKRIL